MSKKVTNYEYDILQKPALQKNKLWCYLIALAIARVKSVNNANNLTINNSFCLQLNQL